MSALVLPGQVKKKSSLIYVDIKLDQGTKDPNELTLLTPRVPEVVLKSGLRGTSAFVHA